MAYTQHRKCEGFAQQRKSPFHLFRNELQMVGHYSAAGISCIIAQMHQPRVNAKTSSVVLIICVSVKHQITRSLRGDYTDFFFNLALIKVRSKISHTAVFSLTKRAIGRAGSRTHVHSAAKRPSHHTTGSSNGRCIVTAYSKESDTRQEE